MATKQDLGAGKIYVPFIHEEGIYPLHNNTDLLKVLMDFDYASDQSRRSTKVMTFLLNDMPGA
jgi:hypothetical protein